MKTTKITTLVLGVASAMAFAQDGSACIPFVNGSGDYDKHCYNSGLLDMEEGKCYTFNPDRIDANPVPQWVNNIASQSWWWIETPCIEEVSSSSVEPESSSSSEESSSSVEESSSSEEPLSSSSEEPVSSSSEEPESSSSEEVSSSSEEPASSSSEIIVASKCEEFVRGSGNYTTDKCYNAGLADMEEGKCYKLKDDRANDVKGQQWINDRANDSWWSGSTTAPTIVGGGKKLLAVKLLNPAPASKNPPALLKNPAPAKNLLALKKSLALAKKNPPALLKNLAPAKLSFPSAKNSFAVQATTRRTSATTLALPTWKKASATS